MEEHEELLGADFFEHSIRHGGPEVARAVSVLKHFNDHVDPEIPVKSGNKGHDAYIKRYKEHFEDKVNLVKRIKTAFKKGRPVVTP